MGEAELLSAPEAVSAFLYPPREGLASEYVSYMLSTPALWRGFLLR